jgi:adenylyltransferase/sulfurtransferase
MRSAKAIEFLKSQGYTLVVNLSGGILAWAEKVDPGMTRY